MKVIVAGGRDYRLSKEQMKWLVAKWKELKATVIVNGGCRGVDHAAQTLAQYNGFNVETFPAEWDLYGKAGGPFRNERMAKYADACILFPGGAGTNNMEKTAMMNGLKIIRYSEALNAN